MNGLACAHWIGSALKPAPEPPPVTPAQVAEFKRRARLPYLCQTCGARTNHQARHSEPDGSRMCEGVMVWDGPG